MRLGTVALLYPVLLAGGEDLTQNRRDSQRFAESSFSLRFSAFLCVSALVQLGHDVLDIRGTVDQGMDDDLIWTRLLHEQRLLISTDKGFAQHRQEAKI